MNLRSLSRPSVVVGVVLCVVVGCGDGPAIDQAQSGCANLTKRRPSNAESTPIPRKGGVNAASLMRRTGEGSALGATDARTAAADPMLPTPEIATGRSAFSTPAETRGPTAQETGRSPFSTPAGTRAPTSQETRRSAFSTPAEIHGSTPRETGSTVSQVVWMQAETATPERPRAYRARGRVAAPPRVAQAKPAPAESAEERVPRSTSPVTAPRAALVFGARTENAYRPAAFPE